MIFFSPSTSTSLEAKRVFSLFLLLFSLASSFSFNKAPACFTHSASISATSLASAWRGSPTTLKKQPLIPSTNAPAEPWMP